MRGLVERHTAQSQPTIGTPTEVPVPRNVKVREPAIVLRGHGGAVYQVEPVRMALSELGARKWPLRLGQGGWGGPV